MFEYYETELIEIFEGDFDEASRMRDELCYVNEWFNCNSRKSVKCKRIGLWCRLYNQYKEIKGEKSSPRLCAGTGTGGTLMGTNKFLKKCTNKINAREPRKGR